MGKKVTFWGMLTSLSLTVEDWTEPIPSEGEKIPLRGETFEVMGFRAAGEVIDVVSPVQKRQGKFQGEKALLYDTIYLSPFPYINNGEEMREKFRECGFEED